MRIVLTDMSSDEPVTGSELARAGIALILGPTLAEHAAAAVTGQGQNVRRGAFTHIGSIGEHGRVSYSKFSAVFGPGRFPGSNCGISILGSKGFCGDKLRLIGPI